MRMIVGRLIGTFLGYLIAKIPGAILGFGIGYLFDRALARSAISTAEVQRIFFTTTFSVMGHIAKADGHVSESEIQEAERVMQLLRLTPSMRTEAIQHFNQGKSAQFNLDNALNTLATALKGRFLLMNLFIEIQLAAGYVDGYLSDIKRAKLVYVCERLGFNRMAFAKLNSMHQAEEKFKEYQQKYFHHQYQKMRGASGITEAYKLLGVDSKASDADVKKAYRKLMSEHHPDKLIAKGLPQEMIRIATEKTQEIKSAYELIQKVRGNK